MPCNSVSTHQPPQVGELSIGNRSCSESMTCHSHRKNQIMPLCSPCQYSLLRLHSPPPRKYIGNFNFQSRERTPTLENSPYKFTEGRGVTHTARKGDKKMLQRGIVMPTDNRPILVNLAHHPILFPSLSSL